MNRMTRATAAASVAILLSGISNAGAQETTGSATSASVVVRDNVAQTVEVAIDQSAEVVGHSVETSGTGGSLTFDLANGEQLQVALSRGSIRLNGDAIGEYDVDGPLAEAWGEFLTDVQGSSSAEVLDALRGWDWNIGDVTMADFQKQLEFELAKLTAAEAALAGVELRVDAVPETSFEVVIPEIAIPAAQFEGVGRRGDASPSVVGGIAGNFLSLLASLVALTFMGFGYLFFAPRQLSHVADTAWHSFGRSFLTGLFAQPLLVPAFGAMIAGLALTVVGILVIPFAIPAFVALLILSVTGGYIALARSVGEIYIRRKGGIDHEQPGWMELKYVFFGLLGLLSIWLPAVLLSWVPVAGTLLMVIAAVMTWVLATAGFGATILTRGGVRGTIVRRLDYALTDQQLWDTTPGITSSTGWKSRAGS